MAIPLQEIPAPPIKDDPSINSEHTQRVPDTPTQQDADEAPHALEAAENESHIPLDSESSVHFILAATMNFIGIIISRLVTRKKQGSLTASLAGLSFNFILVSLAMFSAACFSYWMAWVFVMLGCFSLAIAVILATGAYCASERPGTGKGYASEFVLFMLVGILFFPLSLFGMFHPHRRANLGALLGASVTLFVGLEFAIWSCAYTVPWYVICASILVGLVFFGFLGCVIHKLRKDSLTAGNVFTFLCASFLMGPFAWFAAFLSRNRQAITGSMIGAFCSLLGLSIVMLIAVYAAAWIVLPVVLLSLLFAAFLWVVIDYRRAARRRQQRAKK